MHSTTLVGENGQGPGMICGIKTYGSMGSAVSITDSSLPKGKTTVTVSDASAYSVGDYCYMDQENDPAYINFEIPPSNRSLKYMHGIFKVIAKNGNTLTMDRPLRHYFGSSFNPTVKKMNVVKNSAVENLKMMNYEWTQSEWYANRKYCRPLGMEYAVNCWVKDVYFYNGHQEHFATRSSARNTVKDCQFHRLMWGEWGRDATYKDQPFNNYSIYFANGSADNLITNNIWNNHWIQIVQAVGANGNVFSYNYSFGTRNSRGIFLHGRYPHENLIESNDFSAVINGGGSTWGRQGPRNTFFRNRGRGIGRFATYEHHKFSDNFVCDSYNYLLNIAYAYMQGDMGAYEAGWANNMDHLTTNMWVERNIATDTRTGNDPPEWGLKLGSSGSTTDQDNFEGSVAPAGWSAYSFPASLYLTSKPAWWPGGKPWPCTGADIDDMGGTLTKLPAHDRADSASW
jgi:hypothetical protein